MTRRRLVALVSAAVLLTLGLLVFATGLFVLHTDTGREKLREIARPLIARAVGGSVYLGHLSGSFINGIVIDSIAIRDKRGELFLSTGRVAIAWNPRDLIDSRVYLRQVDARHPFLHLVQHENGEWNFREIFGSSNAPPKRKELTTRTWGDYVVIDSATVHDATVLLTMPWHPDDTLHGVARDSSIRAHLETPTKSVTKTYDGYGHTYAWRNANGLVSHARLADPDSDAKYGLEVHVASLSVDEYDPTFKIRNLAGMMRHLGDSIWFQSPHFDMPASTGHGQGKVWWGNDQPMHYDIAVRGDSVGLDDINWVYATLPRTGGGSVDLAIQNDPKNTQIVDFNLANMDVRSTGSHLTGQMAFGINAPVLLVRRVDLKADPVDFELLKTLSGKPFPEDWRGQLFGTVKGRGGPLTNFMVDDARMTFDDAHVRGAVSRASGKGELDILNPALTAFHGFDVDASAIDLRTIEYLFPNFPRLGGIVSGTATLDSSWLDVRFSNAHLVHQDGPGDPTRVSGSGRITYGEPYMNYDVALNMEPLSLTMLSRSYPLHLNGLMSGPVTAKGAPNNLEVSASLQGEQGAFSFTGRVDADSADGYGGHGRGEFSGLALAPLLNRPIIPMGSLSGHYDLDLAGESASTLRGTADIALEPTTIKGVRVYQANARVRFADGQMSIDSLRVHTKAASLVATTAGGIGLPHGRPDSLAFQMVIDSLGGLRPLIAELDTTEALPSSIAGPMVAATPDSLAGKIQLDGVLRGTLDSLSVSGRLAAGNLAYRNERADTVHATFDLRDVFRAPTGSIDFVVDTAVLAGVSLDSINASLVVTDSTHRRFALAAKSHTGPAVGAGGTWQTQLGSQNVLIDSLGLIIGSSAWRLDRPTHLVIDSTGSHLDSLVLRNRDTAVVSVTEAVPQHGAAFAQLRGTHVPLHDLSTLFQMHDSLSGTAELFASATGTKAKPEILANALVSSVQWAGMKVDHATAQAEYQSGRMHAGLDVVRGGQSALKAQVSLPADITLPLSANWRLNDSVSGSLHADSTDLSILQPLFPSVSASGFLKADVDVSGTLASAIYHGGVAVTKGRAVVTPLNITLDSISANVNGGVSVSGRDSVSVKLSARTLAGPTKGRVEVNGWIKNLMQRKTPIGFYLAVGLDSLHAYNKRTVADVYVTTPRNPRTRAQTDSLRLTGTTDASTLTGSLSVDHTSIFLLDADLARKQVVELDSISGGGVSGVATSGLFTKFRTGLSIPSVNVNLGEDVRLRSAEADVRLGGSLLLAETRGSTAPNLVGQLNTIGGTYNLNLGIVQREFQVLSDGTVTFDGPSDNPLLNVKAQYAVKQYHDRDLNVIVSLRGRVKNPNVVLSGDADYDISQSDLVSYLVLGKPGLDFGTGPNGDPRQVLASVLAPTLSAFAADRLRQTGLGSFVDDFQFQLGGGNFTAGTNTSASSVGYSSYLYGATIGAEKQVTNNLYLNVNTGLCQLQNFQGSRSALSNLGAKAEFRFNSTHSLQLAYDPPTATRTCSADGQQSIVGLVPTPLNLSLAFSHTWRF